MTEYPKKRNLDGCYFRVCRNGKFENVCFTDLTEVEQQKVCENRGWKWLTSLVMYLSGVIRGMGDRFDICYVDEDDNK